MYASILFLLTIIIQMIAIRSLQTIRPNAVRHFSRFTMSSLDTEAIKTILAKPHPNNNIPPQIIEKIGINLHTQPNHPLGIIKTK